MHYTGRASYTTKLSHSAHWYIRTSMGDGHTTNYSKVCFQREEVVGQSLGLLCDLYVV